MNFNEWYEQEIGSGNKPEYEAAKWAWNHQQAKIDAITKQRDSFIKAHHIAMNDVCENKAKIDELQARIDEALYAADESCGVSVAAFVKLNRILKGNKDEN